MLDKIIVLRLFNINKIASDAVARCKDDEDVSVVNCIIRPYMMDMTFVVIYGLIFGTGILAKIFGLFITLMLTLFMELSMVCLLMAFIRFTKILSSDKWLELTVWFIQ